MQYLYRTYYSIHVAHKIYSGVYGTRICLYVILNIIYKNVVFNVRYTLISYPGVVLSITF